MNIEENDLTIKNSEVAVGFSTLDLKIGMRYEILKRYEVVYIGFKNLVEWNCLKNVFFETVFQESINPVHVFYNEKNNYFETIKIGTISKELGLIGVKKIENLISMYKGNCLEASYNDYIESSEAKRTKKIVENSVLLNTVINSVVKQVNQDWYFTVYRNHYDDKINYALLHIHKTENSLISFDIVQPEHWDLYKDFVDIENLRKIELKVSKLIKREAGFFMKIKRIFKDGKNFTLPRQLKINEFKHLKLKNSKGE